MFLRTATVCIGVVAAASAAAAGDWPRWRGPDGNAIAAQSDVPVRWSASSNARWKTALPGEGSSSPVVWGEHLFVTSAADHGNRRLVHCLDSTTGRLRWTREIADENPEITSALTGHAAPTPVTDGRRVVAFFGNAGVVCYDVHGHELWHRDFGDFESELGIASSPILHGDTVILACDHDGDRFGTFDSFVIGLDASTGETRWKTGRPKLFRSWSTPIVVPAGSGRSPDRAREGDRRSQGVGPPGGRPAVGESAGSADPRRTAATVANAFAGKLNSGHPTPAESPRRTELVISGQDELRGYDPATGEHLWTVTGLSGWVAPSPVFAHGLIFAASGRNGPLLAVRPGGRGDVTKTHVVWRQETGGPYVCSPLVYGDELFVHNEQGVLTRYDARSGTEHDRQRLAGKFTASAVAADGRIYITNEDGVTFVFSAGPRYELLAKNDLGERCLASPAISGDRLLIRGERHLFCLGTNPDTNTPGPVD